MRQNGLETLDKSIHIRSRNRFRWLRLRFEEVLSVRQQDGAGAKRLHDRFRVIVDLSERRNAEHGQIELPTIVEPLFLPFLVNQILLDFLTGSRP